MSAAVCWYMVPTYVVVLVVEVVYRSSNLKHMFNSKERDVKYIVLRVYLIVLEHLALCSEFSDFVL